MDSLTGIIDASKKKGGIPDPSPGERQSQAEGEAEGACDTER